MHICGFSFVVHNKDCLYFSEILYRTYTILCSETLKNIQWIILVLLSLELKLHGLLCWVKCLWPKYWNDIIAEFNPFKNTSLLWKKVSPRKCKLPNDWKVWYHCEAKNATRLDAILVCKTTWLRLYICCRLSRLPV